MKHLLLLTALVAATLSCNAVSIDLKDGFSQVQVKERKVSGVPKGDAIQATINGHVLSVVFTENLGQVAIDISTAAGTSVDYSSLTTPNGVNFYIPNTGSYVVTFTLPNGDEYYGEFEVTD